VDVCATLGLAPGTVSRGHSGVSLRLHTQLTLLTIVTGRQRRVCGVTPIERQLLHGWLGVVGMGKVALTNPALC